MPHTEFDKGVSGARSGDRYGRALAVAVAGLESIRDEGPDSDPAYPDSGGIEAHDSWGFDSASYERAQTALETLESVAAIMEEGQPTPMGAPK